MIEASLPLAVAEAADEVALPEAELDWLPLEEAVAADEAELAATSSAVAFRLPHC